MQIVASYHHKGGVGKTTTAVALAAQAASKGARTLLWDLDPQGASTRLLGAERGVDGGVEALLTGKVDLPERAVDTKQARLELLPADLSLRAVERYLAGRGQTSRLHDTLKRTAGRYDVIVLDCPPSVSIVAEAIIQAADVMVVPLTAGPLAWSAYADLFTQLAEVVGEAPAPHLHAFLTMVDRRKRLHRDLAADLSESADGLSAVSVPTDSRVERMALDEDPVRAVLTGRAGHAYAGLWEEVAALPAVERVP